MTPVSREGGGHGNYDLDLCCHPDPVRSDSATHEPI